MPSHLSKRSSGVLAVVVALGLAAACSPRPLRTADSPPPVDSKGIAVDPISSVPGAADKATVTDSVVTLRAPVATEAVMALVRRVFEAFHARDARALDVDLDDSIVDVRADNQPIKQKWQFLNEMTSRMKATAAFEQLDVDAMYRPADVEIYAYAELGLPGRPSRPTSMSNDDLLVRIPIATPRLGADILFGDEIRLLLRRDGARYRIRGYGEVVPR
jgi:hypothetical protein